MSPGRVPTTDEIRVAAAVLDELARAHSTAWSKPATREALAVVADWLARVATPSRHTERCECGASLAHVAGAAALCPVCDCERLFELAEPAP
jgi:hypothetical protein